MEKLFAMNIAATLTGAVISNLEDNLTVDVDIKDPNLRAENLMTWEIFRIFYHAVKDAAQDQEHWPAPQGEMTNLFQSATRGFSELAQNPIVQEILRKLIGTIPAPVIVPNPGSDIE